MNKSGKCAVYLAGKMSGLTYEEMSAWREYAEKEICKISEMSDYHTIVANPVRFFDGNAIVCSDCEIMEYDLRRVKSSDVIIVNLDGLETSIGTVIELYEAKKRDIPVIAFGNVSTYDCLHPWVKTCITRRENHVDDAIEYLSLLYFI